VVPIDGGHILLDHNGRPWGEGYLGASLVRWLAKIDGFPGVVSKKNGKWKADRTLHGLRYYLCKSLAEAGCTVFEIMAITGHKTVKMVEKYTRMYSRETTASTAIDKLVAYDHQRVAAQTGVQPPPR